ncbi:hypothetical protein XU18_3031 [Perkinsela sp. CCAP 1560/4]|nr:hypothetical protein XU18_3031 [Perkinsela sp. CCAP 1560/4]|eukprot:KNH06094.1 hypothetical protein XU18_3031 [Perkinsela sp. CCAP 1560/4]
MHRRWRLCDIYLAVNRVSFRTYAENATDSQQYDTPQSHSDIDVIDAACYPSVPQLFEFYREFPHFHFDALNRVGDMPSADVPNTIFATQRMPAYFTCLSMHQLCVQWVFFTEIEKFLAHQPQPATKKELELAMLCDNSRFKWRHISCRLGYTPLDIKKNANEIDCFLLLLRRIHEIHMSLDADTIHLHYSDSFPLIREKYRRLHARAFRFHFEPVEPCAVRSLPPRMLKSTLTLADATYTMEFGKTSYEIPAHSLTQSKNQVNDHISNFRLQHCVNEAASMLRSCREALRSGDGIPLDLDKAQKWCHYLVRIYNSTKWERSSVRLRRDIRRLIALNQTLQNFIDPLHNSIDISTFEDKLIFYPGKKPEKKDGCVRVDFIGETNQESSPSSK